MIAFALFAILNLDFGLIGETRANPFQLIASTPEVSTNQGIPSASSVHRERDDVASPSTRTLTPYSSGRIVAFPRHQRFKISRCQNGRCLP